MAWAWWERVDEDLVRERREVAREIGVGERVPRRVLAVAREVSALEPGVERWEGRVERMAWVGLLLVGAWFSYSSSSFSRARCTSSASSSASSLAAASARRDCRTSGMCSNLGTREGAYFFSSQAVT